MEPAWRVFVAKYCAERIASRPAQTSVLEGILGLGFGMECRRRSAAQLLVEDEASGQENACGRRDRELGADAEFGA